MKFRTFHQIHLDNLEKEKNEGWKKNFALFPVVLSHKDFEGKEIRIWWEHYEYKVRGNGYGVHRRELGSDWEPYVKYSHDHGMGPPLPPSPYD